MHFIILVKVVLVVMNMLVLVLYQKIQLTVTKISFFNHFVRNIFPGKIQVKCDCVHNAFV